MANPSFDIVSKVEHQEVDNALRQTSKEILQRYDFRGVDASIEWTGDDAVTLRAETEERIKAAYDVFTTKLVHRSVSLKNIDPGEPIHSGKSYRMVVAIKQGIDSDAARKIAKAIRDEGPKGVQAQIQGDQLRVTGKKKDDLQDVIALVKENDFGLALQFTNYR
ncbi:MAG: YajQ family cyclic di-GMP-binding protein [Mycobacteriales bacterium]